MDTINSVLNHELYGVFGKLLSYGETYAIYVFVVQSTQLQVTASVRCEEIDFDLPVTALYGELVSLAAEYNGQLVAACTTLQS